MGTHRQPRPVAQPGTSIRATQEQARQEAQARALAQLDCLRDVDEPTLLQLAAVGTLRAFTGGACIVNERAASDFLYIVLRGTVSLLLHDRAGREVLIGVLDRGDSFGEGPLFGDLFRSTTAYATTTCTLLQLSLDDVRALLPQATTLARNLRHNYSKRLVESVLGRVPVFSQLSPLQRTSVAALLEPHVYGRGDLIIHEGEPGEALYLVESGQVAVEQAGQVIAHLQEGDFFGEMSLLTDSPHNADIRALTPVDVLTLPVGAFRALLAQQPLLDQQLQQVVASRHAARVDRQHNPAQVAQLAAVVEHGLLRGTHVFVRDPALCEDGCRRCETACAARHGRARLRVDGLAVDGLHVAETCRQCRIGAECVEACPEQAITWNAHGALIINDRCTGCGACVPACPYDAMQLVATADPQPRPWQVWQHLKRLRQPTITLDPLRPAQRADKCDMCHGYADLACVSACPTGALRLVPVENLLSL